VRTKEQRDMAAAYLISKYRAELDPNREHGYGPHGFTIITLWIVHSAVDFAVKGDKYTFAVRGKHSVLNIWCVGNDPEHHVTISEKLGPEELNAILELEIQEALVYEAGRDTGEKNR